MSQVLDIKIRNYRPLVVVLIFCKLLLFSSNSKAAVLTVNNAGNGSAQFSSISAALTASSTGDTLYISPSSTSYGSITIDKSLVILGKGNAADVQQPLQTALANITINAHITNVSILGLRFDYVYLGIADNLIAISRCSLNGVWLNDSISNIVVSNCIFTTGSENIIGADCATAPNFVAISNVLLQNNIFNGYIFKLFGSNIIRNNIFLNSSRAISSNFCGGTSIQYALIENNIFYRADPFYGVIVSCIFNKNITYTPSSTFGILGGNNIDNTDPQFVNFPAAGDYFGYNYDFHLKSTSPGKNAGTDGKDIGIYGGNYDVSLTGEPIGIPVIRKMDVQNFNVPQSGNLNVNVRSTKAR